jgi:hypothetical protein
MAAGVTVDTSSNPWVISYAASSANTLPFKLWPLAGYAGPISPFIVRRLVAIGEATIQGGKIILQDDVASPNGPNTFAEFIATGADYEPPQEWKRDRQEGAPFGCTITQFDVGWTLFLHL